MPPKAGRLTRSADFDRLFKTGATIDAPDFRIKWIAGTGKVAVVVAKTAGSIARRNTLKRRWKEALSKLPSKMINELDLVIVVKPSGAKRRGEAIEQALTEALRRLKQ